MKGLIATLYYLTYMFLAFFSHLVIAAAAMNRSGSFIGSFGFVLFIVSILLWTVYLIFTYKKANKKQMLIIGGLPLAIYIPVMLHFIINN